MLHVNGYYSIVAVVERKLGLAWVRAGNKRRDPLNAGVCGLSQGMPRLSTGVGAGLGMEKPRKGKIATSSGKSAMGLSFEAKRTNVSRDGLGLENTKTELTRGVLIAGW